MDKRRKKELREQYKQMKPQMGVLIIRSTVTPKCYIQATQDLRGVMNGARVRLEAGIHPNKELQKEWNEFGSESFVIEVLESLEYEKDESKTDYSDDVALLQMMWEERVAKEGIELYRR